MSEQILENSYVDKIVAQFDVPRQRIHATHESDAELIELGKELPYFLAITMDSLCEEIASGLYRQPYLMGWMLATVNFSDLAAVGAQPLGLVISLNLPESVSETQIRELTRGINDACQQSNTFVLGGDTNSAPVTMLSGCAIGTVPRERSINRIGCRPGDRIYLTAPAGLGNAFAVQELLKQPLGIDYRPRARLKEGQIIRQFASACMDTSDGLIHTLDQLMRLNYTQMLIFDQWEKEIHPLASQLARRMGLPRWLMLAGFHGEFELCCTIPAAQESAFLKAAQEINWHPVLLGEVRPGEGMRIRNGHRETSIDSAFIRNLSAIASRDAREYIQNLIQYSQMIQSQMEGE